MEHTLTRTLRMQLLGATLPLETPPNWTHLSPTQYPNGTHLGHGNHICRKNENRSSAYNPAGRNRLLSENPRFPQ
jgi:hypothetical protein